MRDKKLVFECYRYQLNPVKNNQLQLFGKSISFEELKSKKNELFSEAILSRREIIIPGRKGTYKQVKVAQEGSLFIYKFASQKELNHTTEELKEERLSDYPYVYMFIDNNPQNQIIAVSRYYKAFQNTEVVINSIENFYNEKINSSQLSFFVSPILNEKDYWETIEKYRGRIRQIRFDIIRPNISNISSALRKEMKDLIDTSNSHKTKLELNSPEKQTLEDINQNNQQIASLSDYSIKGGGEISLKVKGIKQRIKTSESKQKFEIAEATLKGNAQDILTILSELANKE